MANTKINTWFKLCLFWYTYRDQSGIIKKYVEEKTNETWLTSHYFTLTLKKYKKHDYLIHL